MRRKKFIGPRRVVSKCQIEMTEKKPPLLHTVPTVPGTMGNTKSIREPVCKDRYIKVFSKGCENYSKKQARVGNIWLFLLLTVESVMNSTDS